MRKVRIGIVGAGVMGAGHARTILEHKVKRATLAAVCDASPARLECFKDKTRTFAGTKALTESGCVDAVVIATPHYYHTTEGIAALKAGLHVLVEKPISVHKADCERLIAARKGRKQIFAAMFQQRTDPLYIKLRKLIVEGELGAIQRVNWIITDWFRTDFYYASGGWRATWKGEGGGVLMNQSPHQLDLLQWLTGMPAKVRAFCRFGRYHRIEVEDDVTAYFEYKNGATGVFITTTGEAPGTNRLEIAGDRGRVIAENRTLAFTRNKVPASVFRRTSKEMFATPPARNVRVPVTGTGGQHAAVLQNFVDAILDGTPLIAPGEEGIRSVELANAMVMSSVLERTVDLPLDAKAYERCLNRLIAASIAAR